MHQTKKNQVVVGLILPAVVNEFHFTGPIVNLGQNIGLLVGAAFWGFAADIWGRRSAFLGVLFVHWKYC